MTCASIWKQLFFDLGDQQHPYRSCNLWLSLGVGQVFWPFTLHVTVDTLLYSSRHVPIIVTPRLSNHFTATMLLASWKSMSAISSLHLYFIIAILFWLLQTAPKQYIPLSKSFSINVGEWKKLSEWSIKCVLSNFLDKYKTTISPSPSCFFPFYQDQTHTDILFRCSIDSTPWNTILLACFSCTAYKTFHLWIYVFINWLLFCVWHCILKCFIYMIYDNTHVSSVRFISCLVISKM